MKTINELKNMTKEQIRELILKKKKMKGEILGDDEKFKVSRKKSRSKKFSSEEIYELEKDRQKTKKQHKEENKDSIERSKLSREVKQILRLAVEEFKTEMQNEYKKQFQEELSRLKNDGIFYKSEFKEFTVDDIAKIGTRKIGERGWRYCTENNGKMLFQRVMKGE